MVPVVATPTPNTYVHPPNGICTDYTITEQTNSSDAIWGLPKFQTNFDIAYFLFNSTRKDSQVSTVPPISGYQNRTNNYTVSATFCSPQKPGSSKETTVLVATHGLGYDGRYWASSYKPEEYSFAQYALENGYSVFWYDRVGTGRSQIVSGYENSVNYQAEILAQIVRKMKIGAYTGNVTASKVVAVGHSMGSRISNIVLSKYGDLVDGAVLTGMALGNDSIDPFPLAAVIPRFLSTAFRPRLADTDGHDFVRDTGYADFGDIYAHAQLFFRAPYDISTVEYAQSIRQPLSLLEFLSVSALNYHAPSFTKPIMLTTGENDFLVCGGNCTTSFYQVGEQASTYSHAQVIETYLHPHAGHGTNFATNATGFYGEIMSFLDRNI
ncbi:hypothetical protein LTR84_009104 [Exophiala bonariae]|uniref:Serine aminopeptidase S33 domain-containing protein n=1 Tax=Exophiala bonariae TaxID=1690606 RepID=A0AAV9MUZ8_9EURO|nr:hypothetical protein LTR84_009104 [Exophiala bonariae]